jgi:hypothetical protein
VIPGVGLYSSGMHEFVVREFEIGHRAACYEDSERCGYTALDDLAFMIYLDEHELGDDYEPDDYEPHLRARATWPSAPRRVAKTQRFACSW